MSALNKIAWTRISACNAIFKFVIPNKISCRHFSTVDDVELPPKPKKPPTSFVRYLKDIRSSIEKEYPGANYQGIMKIAAEKWRVCSPEVKNQYTESYAKDKESYFYERNIFDSHLTEDQKAAFEEINAAKIKNREKRKLNKGFRELGKPKGSPSPFALFLSTRKGMKLPHESLKEWVTRIASEWKNTPEIEKKVFVDQAKALRLQFEKGFDLWKKEALKVKSENPVVKKAQKPILLEEECHQEKLPKLLADAEAELRKIEKQLSYLQKKYQTLEDIYFSVIAREKINAALGKGSKLYPSNIKKLYKMAQEPKYMNDAKNVLWFLQRGNEAALLLEKILRKTRAANGG